MAEKLKMLMDIFGKITFGVLMAAAVFISVFEGFDAQISVKILWQILAVSAVCQFRFLCLTQMHEGAVKKGNVCQTAIIFHFCEHCSFRAWKNI